MKLEKGYSRVFVNMSRELRLKLKCIVPIYDHSISSLANHLLTDFVARHESKETKEMIKKLKSRILEQSE